MGEGARLEKAVRSVAHYGSRNNVSYSRPAGVEGGWREFSGELVQMSIWREEISGERTTAACAGGPRGMVAACRPRHVRRESKIGGTSVRQRRKTEGRTSSPADFQKDGMKKNGKGGRDENVELVRRKSLSRQRRRTEGSVGDEKTGSGRGL